jgi:hypothetical protein
MTTCQDFTSYRITGAAAGWRIEFVEGDRVLCDLLHQVEVGELTT